MNNYSPENIQAVIFICLLVFLFGSGLIWMTFRRERKISERKAKLQYQKDIQELDYRHRERMAIIGKLSEYSLEKSLSEVERVIEALEGRTINKEIDK